MAKFELKFIDVSDDYRSITTELYNGMNQKEIFIEINDSESNESLSIYLDKSTAIKFAKTLRTEINKITESEVKNG
jgi:hypothetical protein